MLLDALIEALQVLDHAHFGVDHLVELAGILNRCAQQVRHGHYLRHVLVIYLSKVFLIDQLNDGDRLPQGLVQRLSFECLLNSITVADHLGSVSVDWRDQNGMNIGAISSPVVDRGLVVCESCHLVRGKDLARVEDLASQANCVAKLVPVATLILSFEVLLLFRLRQLLTLLNLVILELLLLFLIVRFFILIGK